MKTASMLVLLATLFFFGPAFHSSAASEHPFNLDGQSFKAGIIRKGATNQLEDTFTFEDGTFSSAMCKRYNFAAAPYWLRQEGDKVHFRAELESTTDGVMVWQGVISNGMLEGTMRWTKKRWYWTIDTEHRISGQVMPSPRQ